MGRCLLKVINNSNSAVSEDGWEPHLVPGGVGVCLSSLDGLVSLEEGFWRLGVWGGLGLGVMSEGWVLVGLEICMGYFMDVDVVEWLV